jgi:hypothetical protein
MECRLQTGDHFLTTLKNTNNPVGASLLAKNVTSPLSIWWHASSFKTFASKLAPTESGLAVIRLSLNCGRFTHNACGAACG